MAEAEKTEVQSAKQDEGAQLAAGTTPEVDTSTVADAATSAAPVVPSDEAKKVHAFQRAAEDERHKRQKAQEEAAYYRGLAEAAARIVPQNAPKPEDLDLEFMANPSKSVSTAVELAKWETKVELTTDAERDKHPDYDEKEAIFGQQRRLHPEIANTPEFQRNPAKFAYKWASDFLTPKDPSNAPDALAAKVAELEKTIAELRGGKTATEIPQTKAGTRNVTGETAPDANEDWLAEATTKRGGKRPF